MGPQSLLVASNAPAAVVAATLDPANKGSLITLSNGNLTATRGAGAAAYGSVISTTSKTTGKHYFEVHIDSCPTVSYIIVGIGASYATAAPAIGVSATSYGFYQDTGQKYNNNVLAAYGSHFNSGAVIGVAVDMTNGKIWFSVNNAWVASGDPAAGTGAAYSGITGPQFAMASPYQNATPTDAVTFRFAAAAQTYSPPSGFTAWG